MRSLDHALVLPGLPDPGDLERHGHPDGPGHQAGQARLVPAAAQPPVASRRRSQELERRILVVILDEAQNYSQPSLEEVRLLLGLNLPEQPAFALVLIGDEYLLGQLEAAQPARALLAPGLPDQPQPVDPGPMRAISGRRAHRRGSERFGHRTGRRRVARQRQRRAAPQLVPAGASRLDRGRHPESTEDYPGSRSPRGRKLPVRSVF